MRQQNMYKRPMASETDGAQCSCMRTVDAQQIVATLAERFSEMAGEDCDVKLLIALAAEIRQWHFTQQKLDLEERAQTAMSLDQSDALDQFRRAYNAVQPRPTVG